MRASPLTVWLARYGYVALALGVFGESAGIPVPGETLLLAAGVLTARGHLSVTTVILVATAAAVLGDNLGFAVGRRLGRGWLERHGHWVLLTPPRLVRMDAFFERFGPVAVTLARFVTGVRVVAAFAAGASRMPWSTFLVFNVLGAVLWATVVALAGAALGRGYSVVAGAAGRAVVVAVLAVAIVGVGIWVLRYARHTREEASASAAPLHAWVDHIGGHVLAAFAAGLSAAWAFSALAEEVNERETAPFDLAVRNWVLVHHAPALGVLCRAATWVGSTLRLIPAAALLAWWLWRRRGRAVAAMTVLAPVVAALLVVILKLDFRRTRPEGALGLGLGYSFPSGHSTMSAAVACTLAYVLVREGLAPRAVLPLAALFALVVGLSRIYLDVHWATDVIGGWSVGVGIAMLSAALYERAKLAATAHEAARG